MTPHEPPSLRHQQGQGPWPGLGLRVSSPGPGAHCLAPSQLLLSWHPPLRGKSICSKGETGSGLSHSNHPGACVNEAARKSVAPAPTRPALWQLHRAMPGQQGQRPRQLSAGAEEAPSTEANRCWELQKCGSDRVI